MTTDQHRVATSAGLIRHDALTFVEQNWARIWRRINLGNYILKSLKSLER